MPEQIIGYKTLEYVGRLCTEKLAFSTNPQTVYNQPVKRHVLACRLLNEMTS
jgi:hypothetical protein